MFIIMKANVSQCNRFMCPLGDSSDFLKLACMRYHSQCITYSRHALSLEKQTGVPAQRLSNVLLLTGTAAKYILDT